MQTDFPTALYHPNGERKFPKPEVALIHSHAPERLCPDCKKRWRECGCKMTPKLAANTHNQYIHVCHVAKIASLDLRSIQYDMQRRGVKFPADIRPRPEDQHNSALERAHWLHDIGWWMR